MKRLLSVILAAAILMAPAVLPVSAIRGKWGDVIWEIENGTLTVSGETIPSLSASQAAPWTKFADSVSAIVLDESVTVVGERTFEDMSSAVSVDLGNAVNIGKMAFSGCSALKEAQLPDSAKILGNAAFAECVSLSKASLPSGITFVGENVFEGCVALSQILSASETYPSVDGVLMDGKSSSVMRYPPAKTAKTYTIPEGITSISGDAFRDCFTLEAVELGGVTSVGDGAFYRCTALKEINLPSVRSIGRAAFYGCSSLERVVFPSSLASIGEDAFRDCPALSLADFRGNAPDAAEGIFYGADINFSVAVSENSEGFGDTWLGYPVIRHGVYGGSVGDISWSLDTAAGVITLTGAGEVPDFEYPSDAPWYRYRKTISHLQAEGISSIGKNSFRYSAITSLALPDTVTRIGEWAFGGCELLENVKADSVTNIEKCAFFGNISLSHAELGSAQNVGDQVFSGCEELVWVFFGEKAPTLGTYVFDGADAAALYPVGGTGYSGGGWNDIYTEEYLAGDANGDHKFNISDVSLAMKSIAKWDVSLKKFSADTNLDGRVNVTDVSNMMKAIAKWDIEIGIRGH